jgi:hypothetical protein
MGNRKILLARAIQIVLGVSDSLNCNSSCKLNNCKNLIEIYRGFSVSKVFKNPLKKAMSVDDTIFSLSSKLINVQTVLTQHMAGNTAERRFKEALNVTDMAAEGLICLTRSEVRFSLPAGDIFE